MAKVTRSPPPGVDPRLLRRSRTTDGMPAVRTPKGAETAKATQARAKVEVAKSDLYGVQQSDRVDGTKVVAVPTSTTAVLRALDSAQEPGVLFQEEQWQDGHSEEQEDPELAAAVDEAIGLLFGVRGIHHIGPGTNEEGEPVIVIAAGRGFEESSLKAIPPKVHRFATVLALPFDVLPLRRETEG